MQNYITESQVSSSFTPNSPFLGKTQEFCWVGACVGSRVAFEPIVCGCLYPAVSMGYQVAQLIGTCLYSRTPTDERHPLNGHLGVVPRLKSRKSFMTCTKPINTSVKAARLELWRERLEPLDARVHLNMISADEHLPAGAENPWTTWKALNRLRTQVGRSRVNMLKSGFSAEQETCDCGIRQTMQHLLVCPMMDTACSPQDLTTANDIAIGYARHWDSTI